MGRLGVTYQDVANAAEELQAKGINPTIEEIRRLLGTGSSSTIAPHLRKWKAYLDETHTIATKEKLPPEFIALMKGLWTHLIEQADAKIAVIENRSLNEITDIKNQYHLLQADHAVMQQTCQELNQDKTSLLHLKTEQEQKINELSSANAVLQNNVLYAEQQLNEKHEHIAELTRMQKQAQENLEHYRESTREQRLLDQQKNEQQQKQLEQTIDQLQRRLLMADHDKASLQHQFSKLEQKYDALDTMHVDLQANVASLNQQLNATEKARDESLQANQHHLEKLQLLQQKLDEQTRLILKSDNEIARLSLALNTSSEHAKELTAQQQALSQEKWLLTQENIKLSEQLSKIKSSGQLNAVAID